MSKQLPPLPQANNQAPLSFYAEETAHGAWLQNVLPLDALAFTYEQWCRDNGYPLLSMNEQDVNAMTREDLIILASFQRLWEELDK